MYRAGLFSLLLFFFATPVFAQSGHFVLLAQSNVASSSAVLSSDVTWGLGIGNGWVGTSTGAFVADSSYGNSGTVFNTYQTEVMVSSYNDAGYTSHVSDCVFADTSHSYVQSTFFHQLTSYTGDCVFNPSLYYVVYTFFAGSSSGITSHSYFGLSSTALLPTYFTVQASSGPVVPYFSLVGDGFQITPTASSTGLFFSGAQEFCNSAFASSTGIGATIGNGLCIGLGYLFVPTPASIQAFQAIPSTLGATPPMSWFGQIKGILDTAEASSTDNWVNLSIDFGTSTQVLKFTKLDVISTTTMSRYLNDSTRGLIKNLLSVSFFLLAAGLIYSQVKGIWRTS